MGVANARARPKPRGRFPTGWIGQRNDNSSRLPIAAYSLFSIDPDRSLFPFREFGPTLAQNRPWPLFLYTH